MSEQQIIDTGYALIDQFASEAPTATMPASGIVTYQGVGAASPSGSTPSEIIATATSVYQVTAQVDFANSTMTGQAYNFQSTTPGYDISGSLGATGTVSGSSFSGTYSGSMTEQGIPVTYSGTIAGDFVGGDAAAMIGTGSGTATAQGIGTIGFNSYWGAAR
ncbi:transferrin-binding protein-like solute binding protein [Silicimonas sp. MF1-12-2]|uniref:transferrin-binding protein-like solute binding protein n=1 Tax=Silicimonas sp. MF1-12-2 TaxID=3384793 RepID=UPI0039B4FD2B